VPVTLDGVLDGIGFVAESFYETSVLRN
jgi:hypothetical protein